MSLYHKLSMDSIEAQDLAFLVLSAMLRII